MSDDKREYKIERGIFIWEVDLCVWDSKGKKGLIHVYIAARFDNEEDIKQAAVELATREYSWVGAAVERLRPINRHPSVFVSGYEPWVIQEAVK